MAASKVWQCSTNAVGIALLQTYIKLCMLYDYIITLIFAIYFWCMGRLFESQVTDVYFYNLETQQKITVLNQSHALWVMLLLVLKTAFDVEYNYTNMPSPLADGFFEFHYYTKGNWVKWISRDFDDTISDAYAKTGSYLYASVNGCVNITTFVNDYIGSFNAINKITSDELATIAKIKFGGVPVVAPATVLLMEDDTLNEREFTGDDVIVLC